MPGNIREAKLESRSQWQRRWCHFELRPYVFRHAHVSLPSGQRGSSWYSTWLSESRCQENWKMLRLHIASRIGLWRMNTVRAGSGSEWKPDRLKWTGGNPCVVSCCRHRRMTEGGRGGKFKSVPMCRWVALMTNTKELFGELDGWTRWRTLAGW